MQFTALPRQTWAPPLFCFLSLRSSSWVKLLHAVANPPFRYRRQRAGFYQRGSRGSESVKYDSCWRVDARSCCNATTSTTEQKCFASFRQVEVEPVVQFLMRKDEQASSLLQRRCSVNNHKEYRTIFMSLSFRFLWKCRIWKGFKKNQKTAKRQTEKPLVHRIPVWRTSFPSAD